jgi:hypothetical protein
MQKNKKTIIDKTEKDTQGQGIRKQHSVKKVVLKMAIINHQN